jgi:hypothetical protein
MKIRKGGEEGRSADFGTATGRMTSAIDKRNCALIESDLERREGKGGPLPFHQMQSETPKNEKKTKKMVEMNGYDVRARARTKEFAASLDLEGRARREWRAGCKDE